MFLLLALLLAQGPKSLELILRFPQVMQNGTVQVICRVPKDERNRKLAYGLDTALSTIDLQGLDAPITHRRWVNKIGCGPHVAICELTLSTGKTIRRTQDLRVLGCSEDDAEQSW